MFDNRDKKIEDICCFLRVIVLLFHEVASGFTRVQLRCKHGQAGCHIYSCLYGICFVLCFYAEWVSICWFDGSAHVLRVAGQW